MVKCEQLDTGALVAVKLVKNKPAYFNQAIVEVNILQMVHSLLGLMLTFGVMVLAS